MLFAVSDFKQVAPKKTKFGVGTLSLDLSPSSSTTTSTSTTSSSKLTFTSSKDGSTFIINLNDIIKRQASSETDKKPLLRLTVEGGIIVQVTFGSRGDLEAVREQIKIGLEGTSRGNSPVPMQVDGKSSSKSKKRSAPTSPPSPVTTFNSSTSQKTKKRKIATSSSTSALTKVHQHRIKILADSIEIKTTYDELVKGGIMDEEEFWNTHEKDVIIAMSRLSGRGTTKTIADAQLPDFHSSEISFAGEDNVLRLRLLFEVYPNIKRMFEESAGIWRKDFTDEEKEKYRRDQLEVVYGLTGRAKGGWT